MALEIVICGYDEVQEWCWEHDFAQVVSIGEPRTGLPDPLNEDDPSVLRLEFFDTGAYEYDPVGPQEEDVVALIEFLDQAVEESRARETEDTFVLFHCAQGVSRSSASALVCMAIALGPGREQEAVDWLQQAPGGHRASPNTAIVELADDILERGGALFAAMEAVYYAGSA